ncbi:MarR family winged helix-turn-helix transcriptional regulator [Jidongwangia harbinensis]|uniref:MarR family winged helix-turn-helix transcriptional regulator n=1 Tax=Jidongwangia harbinensis TaxID=2878561 RepID=UPI001CD9584F|nr:MarR family transcriptional regulator [Jidongwangia harbinensis]MCA2216689.1 MarR family transcriptional regulator [Jidongwangia harbinensis]
MSDQVPDLPELAEATIAMQHLIGASRELAARASRELGINATDMGALSLLEQHGPMGPAELATRLGIRTASVTVLIDRLERAGHVERSAHPRDRRRVTVAATPSAHRATLEFLRPSILAVDELSRALDPEAHRIVTEFLQRSTRAMQR